MHYEKLQNGFKRHKHLSKILYYHSLAFLIPTTLLDELSWMLWDEEHLPEEPPSVQLFSFLNNLLDFLRPDDKSCKIQHANTTWIQYLFYHDY